MTRFQDRLGRCYELAGRQVLFDQEVFGRDVILVHGTIQRDPLPPNPHAWVIFPARGEAWEPISEITLPIEVFARFFNAVEIARYTPREVAIETARSGHWGPWESERCDLCESPIVDLARGRCGNPDCGRWVGPSS